jgi:hypothetical protein
LFRATQVSALENLIKLFGTMPAGEVVAELLKSVVICSQGGMFTSEQLAPVISHVLRVETTMAVQTKTNDDKCASRAASPTELVAKVLQALQKHTESKIGDIVGQILWRQRKSEALQDPRFKKVAESVDWAVSGDPTVSKEMMDLVDAVFKEATAADGNRMNAREWHKIAKHIKANPILASRLRATDVDRLYYGETHSRGEASGTGINRREFRSLLVQLAFCMRVPPYMVLTAVGCHKQQPEAAGSSRPQSKARPSTPEDDDDGEPVYMRKTVSEKKRTGMF